MPTPTNEQVLDALAQIQDPDLGRDVVSLGMVKELTVDPAGRVSFTFELTTPACPVRDRFKSQAQDAVGGLPGVTAVEVRMTANVRPAFMRPKPSEILPGVKQTIAVASGKGGVGKSTVAVNLADARTGGADHRRRHRVHAAGRGHRHRCQSSADVPQAERDAARTHREHELVRVPELRESARDLQPRWR